MSNLTPFVFDDALVRVKTDENGNPWFVAKDVCNVLDIVNHRDAVSALDDDEKHGVGITDSMGREQLITTISESGLYSLVFRSRKPEARRFRKWVTSEVLPALRKTGVYCLNDTPIGNLPDYAQKLKPQVRSNVLNATMQAARLTNLSTQAEIDSLFLHYCQLIGQTYGGQGVLPLGLSQPQQTEVNIYRFIEENLEYEPGASLPASEIYRAFAHWWRGQFNFRPPSPQSLGKILGDLYPKTKCSNIFYYDIAWKQEV